MSDTPLIPPIVRLIIDVLGRENIERIQKISSEPDLPANIVEKTQEETKETLEQMSLF